MQRFWLFVPYLALLACPAAGGTDVPFDADHWTVSAQEHRFEQHLGRESLLLRRGQAVVKGADFSNGIIEFDIALVEDRGFSGVMWRMQDDQNYEEFYLRHHQSGMPDANQYSPVFNGLSGWQIYTGEAFATPIDYAYDRWTPVKIVVAGDRAEIYVDGETPILHVADLKHDSRTGGLGVKSNGAAVHFSNFRVRGMDDPPLVGDAGAAPQVMPEGVVSRWDVSMPFSGADLEGKVRIAAEDEGGLTWSSLEVETSGIANLARVHGAEDGADTVFARLVLEAEQSRVRKIRFGFSDRVRVYLNGVLLYAGDDTYQSRDYRFLGSIGLYDELYLSLEPGANELWFAVTEGFGGWGLICQLEE